MKKLFISQPMRGLSDEEILKTREEIKAKAEDQLREELELIDSFVEDYSGEINKSVPVWYLGESIQSLSEADVAYFGDGWQDARGCKIEHICALKYGIKTVYYNDDKKVGLNFTEALEQMKQGKKVRYPHWGGYWYWDNIKGTVIMHTKEGIDIDLFDSERKEYTLKYIAGNGFEVMEELI